MKKLILTMLSLYLLLFTANAANGDIIGNVYSTDIRTFVNGVEVKSYNIGGKTAVAIEEIISESSHEYLYNDASRTLKVWTLAPYALVEKKTAATKPGRVVGRIYKTDIKTTIYDVVVPSYNIGGRTAVVIEELGKNGDFSEIGGMYEWNEKDRTISLEFMYDNSPILPDKMDVTVEFNEELTEGNAVFEEMFHCPGRSQHFIWAKEISKNQNVIIPIKVQNEIVGYYFHRQLKNNDFTAFTYYLPGKVEEVSSKYNIPVPDMTREDVISHFTTNHSVGGPVAQFDTDNYSFVYISVAMTSSTSYNLLQVYDDGTYVDYKMQIYARNRAPQGLKIDEENEKVTFMYVDRYTHEWSTHYEIDLKSGTIKEI